jgi:LysM repeat protein
MSAPSLVLENYRTGQQVVIEGADLPDGPIAWGGMVRREVTRYVGRDNTSAQVLGTVDTDITLKGVLDDQWSGNSRGHALRMRLELEGLLYSGDLIRLGYNNDQRWGFLDITFEEETPERITYSLKFEPLYSKPPAPVVLVLAAAPVDSAGRLSAGAELLSAALMARPAIVRDDFFLTLFTAWSAAQNALSRVISALGAVVYYADLTAEMARQVTRTSAGVLRGLGDMSAQLRASGASVVSSVSGPEALRAELWRDDVLSESMALSAFVLSVARDVGAVAAPTSARTHTVKGGETLAGLALAYYGDFGLWQLIADGNGLDDDGLTPGQTLIIPTLPATR